MAAQQRELREQDVFEDVDALALVEANSEDSNDKSDERFAADTSYKALDATQLYLNEIGFSPLLSAEEEVHYARLARKGDEMGRFKLGSTIVVCFEKDQIEFEDMEAGMTTRLGEVFAHAKANKTA